MEADTVYQGCLPSCKLHCRSLTIRPKFKVCRLHMQITRSQDCAHVLCNLEITCSILRLECNLGIPRMCNAISRLHKFSNCTNSQIAWNICMYVYMYVCMYVCMCVYVCMYVCVCMYFYMLICSGFTIEFPSFLSCTKNLATKWYDRPGQPRHPLITSV